AQAREQYFQFRNAVEQALHQLYAGEAKLRYMLGLAATDGRLIRPSDEPTSAKVVFDWQDALGEALARNAELREQKWMVKRREMEMIASKNFLLPRLDAVGRYRWLGLGNDLLGGDTSDFQDPASNAYAVMTGGNFQEWQLGVEFSMPLGFRREMAGVRNAQLILARERAKLQEMELELSHQLSHYIREMESQYVLTQTNWNRRAAAQRQVQAVAEAYDTGTVTIDVLLEAQRRLAVAESDFFRAVVDYNTAITQVHKRKGSLLEYNGVYLAEGPWPAKAYFDAHRRARERDAGMYLDYGFTRPKVISRGPVAQGAGEASVEYLDGLYGDPNEAWLDAAEEPAERTEPAESGMEGIEPIPTPDPTPRSPSAPAPPEPDPQAARAPSGEKRVAKAPTSPAKPRRIDVGARLESLDGFADSGVRQAGGPAPGAGWSVARPVAHEEPVAKTPAPAVSPAESQAPPASGAGWRNVRE
ncbi:MAG: TolC family protein, partial [Thermoguttaceae bacterium]